MSIGVPIKVLHEAEGHIVTCETNTGEVYRGKLIEAEDNMNCQVSCFPHEVMGEACASLLEHRKIVIGGLFEVPVEQLFMECLVCARHCSRCDDVGINKRHLEYLTLLFVFSIL